MVKKKNQFFGGVQSYGYLIGLLPQQTIHDLRTKLQLRNVETNSPRLFAFDALENGKIFDISRNALNQAYVFEFEK